MHVYCRKWIKTSGLKDVDYKLFSAIILTLLVPTLYTTFRIYLISNIPNEWGFNIASQIAWLNIIYEILQEGVILPLFFVLGAVVCHPDLYFRKVKQVILSVVPLYALIALGIWIFSENLVGILSQKPTLIADTVQYIRWETIAIPFRVIADIALIALITLSRKKRIYIFIVLQLLIRTGCDLLFISSLGLDLGIIGVAFSSLVIYVLTSIIGLGLLFYRPQDPHEQNVQQATQDVDWKKWLKVSVLSGCESGVRNIAFIVMILKLVNEIDKSGVLWISNSFIWQWLLLPILALGSLIKKDTGTHQGLIGRRFNAYLILTLTCVLIWIATIPGWGFFINHIMGIDAYEDIVRLTLLLLVFYILFAFNNVFDSYFYGMGRTDLMLYQSLVVNCVYYVIAFILYRAGVFVPTLDSIALLFGFGILVDFIATVFLFYFVQYPRKEAETQSISQRRR